MHLRMPHRPQKFHHAPFPYRSLAKILGESRLPMLAKHSE
jgi:hypothetical protein